MGVTVMLVWKAWAFEQAEDTRRCFHSQDVMVPWCFQRRLLGAVDLESLQRANAVIDDVRGVVTFQRYAVCLPQHTLHVSPTFECHVHRFCHVFKKGELSALFESTGMCEVVEESYEKSNWSLLMIKRDRSK